MSDPPSRQSVTSRGAEMTGYTVHTGTTVKFSDGWDKIFSKGAKKKPAAKKGTKKKLSVKKRGSR
jgi:hypothetical protein